MQQRQNETNNVGLNKWLCYEFDDELIEYLAITMNDFYQKMINSDNIKPDIRTFESLLSILSYYGNAQLSLHFFSELTKVYDLRPDIAIFNCLIACYCNQISLNSNELKAELFDFMQQNIEKTFDVYKNAKNLLIAPNICTMKLLFHCMHCRILLTHNLSTEYTMECNETLLDELYNDDLINYEIQIDEELAHYIVHCWIMIGRYDKTAQIYKDLYLGKKIISHWTENDCINLTNIPKKIYDDVWMFYLQYTIEHEMDKLIQLNELKIVIPKFDIDDRGIDVIQNEIEQIMDITLNAFKIEENDNSVCFILEDCKNHFIAK